MGQLFPSVARESNDNFTVGEKTKDFHNFVRGSPLDSPSQKEVIKPFFAYLSLSTVCHKR